MISGNSLFDSFRLGPVLLKNRVIRAAAFEGMCRNHAPSKSLLDYHQSVAEGGVGMTTVAYASINQKGLSFPHQLWLRNEIKPGLQKLNETVHRENCATSIQIGHCGSMAKYSLIGSRPQAPSTHFNLFGPTYPKRMSISEINDTIRDFGKAAKVARESGFDAIELHAGHGYLISQFLTGFTNKRKDEYGGSLSNRMLFLKRILQEIRKQIGSDMALLVKMNMRDGFSGGMEVDESIEVAQTIEAEGADAIVLSGGFVSKTPMYIMRGAMPIKVLTHHIEDKLIKLGTSFLGSQLIKPIPFREGYFLEDALEFRKRIKIPLVYVGGLISRAKIDEVLDKGFELVGIARALLKDPDFINKLYNDELSVSSCNHCNYCIAVMYSRNVACIQNEKVSPKVLKMLDESGTIKF